MAYLDNIKALRENRGLTQEQVAFELNMSQNTYSKYERGVRAMPIETLVALCQFYDVSADDVLGLSGNRIGGTPHKQEK